MIKINHTCKNCGKTHEVIPDNARPQLDWEGKETVALMWECECKSTMVKLVKQVRPTIPKIKAA